MAQLIDPTYEGHPERAIVFTIEAWDANCPQHIPRRYTEEEIAATVQALYERIAALEAENHALRENDVGPLLSVALEAALGEKKLPR